MQLGSCIPRLPECLGIFKELHEDTSHSRATAAELWQSKSFFFFAPLPPYGILYVIPIFLSYMLFVSVPVHLLSGAGV